MSFQVVTNTQAGNFTFDGAYIQKILSQLALPVGPATNKNGVVGTASWGKVNTPIAYSDQTITQAFGNKTTTVKSLVRESLSAVPECRSFVGVRVTDGTDVAATILIQDSVPATVLTLTAVCSGSYANGASARVDLTAGNIAAGPVFSITVFFPGANPQVFSNIIGYTTAGGPYAAATFKANALAAINGTAAGSVASPYFVATAGASTVAPVTGTAFNGTGGTDGDLGVTDATTVGADNGASSTGMYLLRGQLAGAGIILASLTDPTQFANVAAFAQQEGCIGFETFASGTATDSAVAAKQTNNMSSDYMVLVMDFLQVNDQYQGKNVLVSPIGKAAGIIAGQPPHMYPGNKPETGTAGIVTTERMLLGVLGTQEAGKREQNGINWIGITPNGVLGLPHGLTSSGRQINEVRMLNYIGYSVGTIISRFIGKMLQTSLPIAQADENDPRLQCDSALRTFFRGLMTPGNRQISAASVILNDSNNTTTSMQQGRLLASVNVTTLTGVQFAVAAVQVGNTVQIQTTPVAGA